MNILSRKLRRFAEDTSGAMTAFGLFLTLTVIAVGGLAVDVAIAMKNRTHLQIAADAAAHAALVARQDFGPDAARAIALDVAAAAMPQRAFGNTIRASDIRFGTWDSDTKMFTADPNSDEAVLVDTMRVAARGNSIGTHFLRFAGFGEWNLLRQSVFETYVPDCYREGMVAQEEVDVSSGNTYTTGFCIHSQTYVDAQTDNTFQEKVIVSMPDENDMQMPSDGFTKNPGLAPALRDASYTPRILNLVDEIMAGVQVEGSQYYRSYITSVVPKTIVVTDETKLDLEWEEGRIHVAVCAGDVAQMVSQSNVTMTKGILVTNCRLAFPSNVAFEDAVIASTHTGGSAAISGSNGFRLGKNDNCATGGDVQMLTTGDVKFAADVEFYGAQVIAEGDIIFTSNAAGVAGVSLVAGGMIQGTSNSVMGFCGGAGMENNFFAWYFRMAA